MQEDRPSAPSKETACYYLERELTEWVRARALELGKSGSDVVREVLRDYGPIYEEDMRAHQRRVAARQAV